MKKKTLKSTIFFFFTNSMDWFVKNTLLKLVVVVLHDMDKKTGGKTRREKLEDILGREEREKGWRGTKK